MLCLNSILSSYFLDKISTTYSIRPPKGNMETSVFFSSFFTFFASPQFPLSVPICQCLPHDVSLSLFFQTEGVRVSVDVQASGAESPILFVVRQKQAVVSFQVPLILRGL